jgi:hypothetical protein
MGKEAVRTWVWWENLRKCNDMENPGVNRRIILKFIFKKWEGA